MVGVRTLLRQRQPVHVVLCRVTKKHASEDHSDAEHKGSEGSGDTLVSKALTNELDVQLVATCTLDWRRALGRCVTMLWAPLLSL